MLQENAANIPKMLIIVSTDRLTDRLTEQSLYLLLHMHAHGITSGTQWLST